MNEIVSDCACIYCRHFFIEKWNGRPPFLLGKKEDGLRGVIYLWKCLYEAAADQ